MTTQKRRIGYLILCIYIFIIFVGYVVTFFMKTGPYSVEGVYNLIYLIYVIPLATASYGVLSYILTQRIWLPNLFLFVLFSLLMMLILLFSVEPNLYFWEELPEVLPLTVIMFVISTVFSSITKLIVKLWRLANKVRK